MSEVEELVVLSFNHLKKKIKIAIAKVATQTLGLHIDGVLIFYFLLNVSLKCLKMELVECMQNFELNHESKITVI